jgi:hypothetical protein
MRLGPRVLAFLALTYALLLGGHVYSGDELMMARVTEAIVTRGELAVRPIANFEDYARVTAPDGRQYTWYGLGLSLAAIPFYAAATAAEGLVPPSGVAAFDAPKVLYYDRAGVPELVRMYAVTFVNPLLTALTAVLVCAILLRLGLSRRASALAALAFGLTGVTPFYAKTFFSEPLAGMFLAAGVLAWLAMRQDPGRGGRWAFLAGLAAGASVLARVANGVVLLPAVVALLLEKEGRRRLPAAAAGAAVPMALLLCYNAARFGSPFETGYSGVMYLFGGSFLEGFAGLLASPGRGLLLYVPWVVLALPGVVALARRDRPLAVLIAGSALALWLVYSPWAQWDGGWVYGPRFLVPVLPLLAVAAAAWVAPRREQPWVRALAGALVFVALAFAVQSVQVNFIDYTYAAWKSTDDIEATVRWSWEWSPLLRYWDFPVKDFILLPRLLRGEGGAFLAAFAWTLLAGWVASLVSLGRALARRDYQ